MYTILSRILRPGSTRGLFFKITFFLLVFASFKAHAQYYGDDEQTHGIGINAGYDMPVGNLRYTYKAAPSYGVNYYMFFGNITTNIGIGFREFQPKQDVFYYLVGDNDYGTATFSSFKTNMYYLGAAYNVPLGDVLKIYAGLNMGYYMSKFKSTSTDAFVDAHEDVNEQEGMIAPKLGFNVTLSDHIQVNLQGAYNIFSPLGRKAYYSRVGTVYLSATAGAALIYKF